MTTSAAGVQAPPTCPPDVNTRRAHPRVIGWVGTTALAIGGSNQCLFLITALFIGQNDIPGQGSAAVALLIVGLLLSYAAAPGWTELVLMSPNRVGGIATACTAAFRPYGPILSVLAGVCYWWGWVPTCGVTALFAAMAIQQWCLQGVPVPLIGCCLIVAFTAVNFCGIRFVANMAVPIAAASALLALVSMLAPVSSGTVDWARAVDLHLTVPFSGWFGALTSLMAGLYLVGFGAPAFEAAACHVGETIEPARNVPRAMLASAALAAVYFAALPVVWLGALGPGALSHDLIDVLGPTFAPVFGSVAKSAAIGFLMFNMFHGTMQPLAGAARVLVQLADDGLAPRFLGARLPNDAPWAATLLTAGLAILFLLIGVPIWLIAAANFTYLIGICLPSVAVWLLRRDDPHAARPYRAPRGTIGLGLAAAAVWAVSALLGFQQFGLPTVVFGVLMAYSGAGLYGWRKLEDRRRAGLKGVGSSLHLRLTGAMLLVLALDAAGYMIAVDSFPNQRDAFVVGLEDIFVAVAMLTISVGIVLPGMVAHSADTVSAAARSLAHGTVRDLALAMDALGRGEIENAQASVHVIPIVVHSRDELGAMADSFNTLQASVKMAAVGLDRAREGLGAARQQLLESNAALARTVEEQTRLAAELFRAKEAALHDASHDSLTGLPNRTLFIERLEAALRRVEAGEDPGYAVFFVDLDRFKIVNDSLGHLAGNAFLVGVADRLRNVFHSAGAGSTHDILARLGGDEFTFLLSGLASHDDALAAARRIQDALAVPFRVGDEEVHTSASIGVAMATPGYGSPDEILRDADLAMYRAKTLGKARAEIFDQSLHALATSRLHVENDLRRALRNNEFLLHYQPIVSLAGGEVVGFEALVRWQPPGVGLIYPGDFISVAEETGVIVPLGLWVLREACRKAPTWTARGAGGRPLSMSVNLSPRQFAQKDLVRDVAAVLEETGVDPTLIKLEITESSTMGDPERAIRVLKDLKALGLQLSVDDFGTGYSSLSYLHRFPLDIVKIDRSFVAGLLHSAESRQIIMTILSLAAGMNMDVVAEGIESLDQVIELQHLGCGLGQGYLFSKPMVEKDADAFLRASLDDRRRTPTRENNCYEPRREIDFAA